MFIAKDIDGNIVTIEEAELFANENPNIKRKYFCPSCKNQVFVKAPKSNKVRTHFAHTKKCSDDWKYDMSEWHRNWQNCFPKECQEVVMSNGAETHRVDVCINNTVIEFQHSNITREDFTARNIFYTSLGYDVQWVFDADNKLRNEGKNYLIPFVWEGAYSYMDNFVRTIEWRIINRVFENFIDCRGKVKIYLETSTTDCDERVLLLVKSLGWNAHKRIDIFYTNEYIYQKNFLKEHGVVDDENILSVKDILEKTKKWQDTLVNPKSLQKKEKTTTPDELLALYRRSFRK